MFAHVLTKALLRPFASKLGVLGVVGLGLMAFLVPNITHVAKSESCANPPTVATLNPYPVTFQDQTNGCEDFPALSLRKVNGNWPRSQQQLNNGIDAASGDEMWVRVYVHNGAAVNLDPNQTTARNVRIHTSVDTSSGSNHMVSVTLSADNTNTVTGSVPVRTGINEQLQIIPGSGEVWDAFGSKTESGFTVQADNTKSLGNILACFERSVFIFFRVRVVSVQPSNTNLQIIKEVRNTNGGSFSHTANAQQNQTVEYRIKVKNVGSAVANNVVVTDTFNPNLTFVQGTFTVSKPGATGSLTGGGLQLGDMAVNEEVTITYQATINANSGTLPNTAAAVATNAPSVQDTAQVLVNTVNPGVVCAPKNQTVLRTIGAPLSNPAFFTASGGDGNFSWTAPGGTPFSGNGSSFSTSYPNDGTHTVTVTSNGSSDTCTVQVNQIIGPVVCNPSFQTVDVNQTAFFSAFGGDGNFSWSAPGGNLSSGFGTFFSTSYSFPGTQTVTVTSAGNSANCTVQVNQIFNQVVCNPNFQTVNVNQTAFFNATGGNGAFSWSAPDGNPSSGSGSFFSTSYSTPGNKTVSVRNPGFGYITASATCTVQVISNPPQPVFCNPSFQTVEENQIALFGATGGDGNFTWSAPGGNPSTGFGPSFFTSYSSSGSRTVTVTSAGNSANCTVQVIHGDRFVFCNPNFQNVNVNQRAFFTASGGDGNFTWSAPGGNPGSGSGSSFRTSYSSSGSKVVTVSSGGFTDTCNVQVRQIFTQVVCNPNFQTASVGQTVFFTASGGNGNFSWTASGGSPVNGSGSTFSTIYNSAGSKTVTVSSNGSSDVCNVQVNQVIRQVLCNPNNQSVNVNDSASFTASGGDGNFSWTASGGNPSSGSGSNFSTRYSSPGQRFVTVSSDGSSATCSVQVNQVFNQVVCNPNFQTVNVHQTAFFTASGGDGNFSWNAPGGNPGSGSGSSFSTSYSSSGFKTVIVSSKGTTDTCSVQVSQVFSAVFCTPNFQTVNVNQTAFFSASGGDGNFSWSAPGANPSSGNGSNFTASYSSAGTRSVTVTSSGSSATCTVQVNQSGTKSMSITKLVRNVTSGGSLQSTVNANNNDNVEFQIVVTNTGTDTLNNVRVVDNLPNGLVSNATFNGVIGTLSQGQARTLTYPATVNNSSANLCMQNIAIASADSAPTVQANASVCVSTVLGQNVNLVFSKKAFNDTKNVNATTVTASREDFITYTLTATNTGNAVANNFVITDDLSGVLPFADIVDNGGGTVSNNVITFPAVTVPAGGSVSKTFRVRVKFFLSSNQSFVMRNTYGNTININIGSVEGVATFVAPKTGSAASSAGVFAGLITAGFVGFRKRKKLLSLIFV